MTVYFWRLFHQCIMHTKSDIYCWHYYHWVDTIGGGGLLIPDGIIHPIVIASGLTWFIKYIFVLKLQSLKNVIY